MLKKSLFKNNYFFLIACTLLTLFMSILSIYVAFLLKSVLDTAAYGQLSDIPSLVTGSIIFIGSFLIVTLLRNITKHKFIERGIRHYKNVVFQKLLEKDVVSFGKNSSGDYLSLLLNDVDTIRTDYLGASLAIVFHITIFIFSFIAMISINIILTVIVITTSLFTLIISFLFTPSLTKSETTLSNQNSKFTFLIKDIFSGFPLIKAFRSETIFRKLFSEENLKLEAARKKKNTTGDCVGTLSTTLSYIALFTVYIVGGYYVISGNMTVGAILVFIQLSNYILDPIASLSELLPKRKAAVALIKKNELLCASYPRHDDTLMHIQDFNGSIILKNVYFSYVASASLLTNINYSFEKYKSYAIVGANGSGKSTLLKLLMGYFSDYTGTISIDGHDFKDISSDSILSIFSLVEQDIFIFNTSIRNNITLWKYISDEELISVIRQTELESLIQEKGLDYNCGENGIHLSGGERQRIAIARSLIKKSKVLLFDEGTSALDQKTSVKIESSILNIPDITKIIVTHKLSKTVLPMYDLIIVMQEGKIVGSGTFGDLLSDNLYFQNLYNASVKESYEEKI